MRFATVLFVAVLAGCAANPNYQPNMDPKSVPPKRSCPRGVWTAQGGDWVCLPAIQGGGYSYFQFQYGYGARCIPGYFPSFVGGCHRP